MPELPDLQVFARNLNKQLEGKKLGNIRVINKSKLNVSEASLRKSLEDTTVTKVVRQGKELHFLFSNGEVLALHLMLHGKLHLFEEKNEQKNTILELLFHDKTGLALTDYQGVATPTLNPEQKTAPDALSKEVNVEWLKKMLAKKRSAIKAFLLDQKMIRGIGNAYADEILWEARISPFSVCNKIPDDKIEGLVRTIPEVLHEAEKQIRKKNPDIISGEVRDFLKIHNPKRKESPTGADIKSTMLNSRITYYTDEQKLYQ